MSIPADIVLTIARLLLNIGVLVSKVEDRFGVPALVIILFSGGRRRPHESIEWAWLDRFSQNTGGHYPIGRSSIGRKYPQRNPGNGVFIRYNCQSGLSLITCARLGAGVCMERELIFIME